MDKHYHNNDDNDDDKKFFPKRFYLLYCDECEKYRDFVHNICSHHRSHRTVNTCHYCQNDFKTFIIREVRCSACCKSIEPKFKKYTLEEGKKLANVYKTKRRKKRMHNT